MATAVSSYVTVASGTNPIRGGIGAIVQPPADPVWAAPANGPQTINEQAGTAAQVFFAVDIPSVFSVAQGYTLPPGFSLVQLTSTTGRIDFGATVPAGSYQFALEATPV